MAFNTLVRQGASAAGAYEIERSLRFNNADNVSLTRTVSSSSAGTKATLSFWFKPSALHSAANGGTLFARGNYSYVQFYNEKIYIGNASYYLNTVAVFRDFSAWYHLVFVIDTTQGTATNRQKIYINGALQARGDLVNDPAEDASYEFLNGEEDYIIGKRTSNDMNYMGYMAEIHFADGQALDPTSFGKTDADTGQWIPKRYGGSYGTNGFYLNFSDNSNTTATTLGKDSSGNGNNWTPNNFSVAAGTGNDSLEDTPTNNFCTLNPLVKPYGTNTFSQGALHVDPSNDWNLVEGTFVVKSGKWYWEQQGGGSVGPSSRVLFGICSHGSFKQNAQNPQTYNGTIGYYDETGQKRVNNSYSSYGASYNVTGDVIGTALDMDARTVTFYKNGASQGAIDLDDANDPFLEVTPACFIINATEATFNFGQRPFAHSAPANHKTLCTANITEPTIKDGTKYFNTILYEGNSTDARAITGVGFGPNLVWIKNRDDTDWNNWYDTVRGAGKRISSNSTSVESASTDHMDSIDADGFTLKDGDNTNQNGESYVAWNWKESASAGFDIVSYTGNGSGPRTISHGLGVKPEMIIIKNREQVTNWITYHKAIGAEKFVYLNTDAIQMDDAAAWNDTEPTSSVFTVNADQMNNGNGDDIIAYVFASVEGFSKVGSYTGNGNADGPFIYCGFRPAYILIKRVETTPNAYWNIFDTARDTYNSSTTADFKRLLAHTNSAEATNHANYTPPDILSNGFKHRHGRADTNYDGQKFIFLAFAERPFKYANAR